MAWRSSSSFSRPAGSICVRHRRCLPRLGPPCFDLCHRSVVVFAQNQRSTLVRSAVATLGVPTLSASERRHSSQPSAGLGHKQRSLRQQAQSSLHQCGGPAGAPGHRTLATRSERSPLFVDCFVGGLAPQPEHGQERRPASHISASSLPQQTVAPLPRRNESSVALAVDRCSCRAGACLLLSLLLLCSLFFLSQSLLSRQSTSRQNTAIKECFKFKAVARQLSPCNHSATANNFKWTAAQARNILNTLQ
mmetsp:Transcript_26050/g.46162  ORF Transcript_26050/g.46162 Transcript_26050/m.46162 type:complete len:249 (+) Transcript_26050:1292-2038(+)